MGFRDRSQAFQVAAAGGGNVDPLAVLSDTFTSGPAAMVDRGWVRTDDTTTPAGDGRWTNLDATIGTGYLGQIDAGGGTGSLHFSNNRGCHWHKAVSATRWGVISRVTIRNGADDGDPPLTNYRLGGLLAVADHAAVSIDDTVVAYGSAGGAGPRVYRHHTVAGSSQPQGDGVPGFQYSSTLSSVMTRYIRLLRDLEDSDRWVAQYSLDGVSWTTALNVQRGANALPATVHVGPCVWSDQVGAGVHDFSCLFHFVRFFTARTSDFPA